METTNSKAWEMLNEDEKSCLTLSLGYQKSSWEAGEILNKAHYKYLEIRERAEFFLKIFTNYFNKYPYLITKDHSIATHFKIYLQLTVEERKTISQAVKQMGDNRYIIASYRERLIREQLEILKNSDKPWDNELYNLVMEFDRWHNFRILPKSLQEPSAFKRRNKNRDKKHLSNISNLPDFTLEILQQKYTYKGKYPKAFLPVTSEKFIGKYRVFQIKWSKNNVKKFTDAGLPLFSDRELSEEFGLLCANYLYTPKTSKKGLHFWPDFRVKIKKAINYHELENIHRSKSEINKAVSEVNGEIRDKNFLK